MLRLKCNVKEIKKASTIIRQGGTAIFPTDTVYGIGCNPYDKEAVKKIYKIKSRDISKPFPVLVYSKEIAQKITSFDKLSEKFAERFWPGPLTLILKSDDEKLKSSLNVTKKIAVRVPDHKCTLELLKECDFLVGTSANVSGHSSFRNPDECFKNMKNYDVFIDGGTIVSKGESTIIEVENEKIKIIREGFLSQQEILGV